MSKKCSDCKKYRRQNEALRRVIALYEAALTDAEDVVQVSAYKGRKRISDYCEHSKALNWDPDEDE